MAVVPGGRRFRMAALLALALACASCTGAGGEGVPQESVTEGPVPEESVPEASATEQSGGTVTEGIETALPRGTRVGRARWKPRPGVAWQWQLSGDLDLTVDVPVYDVDWQVPRDVVDRLHRDGRRVICYVSVGTVEEYRDDAGDFPAEVQGRPLADWPDERWLDVRRLDLIGPPLLRRLDVCREKGFDAVEPDNVDAYSNASGFPLTAEDQLRFNRWIARAAHERGMSVGLKNDVDQIAELEPDFDFAVNEQCLQYEECGAYEPFVRAGKAVLHVEYEMSPEEFCAAVPVPGFSSMLKRYDLDAYRHVCPGS
ncbi:hypothetical protein CLV92_11476 [Kineococcus xinjiangensis]|uniref:Glycoside-hydrolase family GH114 TIM-barrel domain-containing protein n=1 Tax=Kineococcus xinjiangensis TaxID=512762 RepID=A0A2S6IE26_9ACTN|nr:endo alpha-1,4 polygalactosaminidase [Kineococcus xinjiangensis]PPK92475.1 hypothetical protein CLV92_11476 [Kineococcus xinjiangensis]